MSKYTVDQMEQMLQPGVRFDFRLPLESTLKTGTVISYVRPGEKYPSGSVITELYIETPRTLSIGKFTLRIPRFFGCERLRTTTVADARNIERILG